jgi:hypothetical protein
MAQPFDVSRRELSGQPVPLAELIQAGEKRLLGARAFMFSGMSSVAR